MQFCVHNVAGLLYLLYLCIHYNAVLPDSTSSTFSTFGQLLLLFTKLYWFVYKTKQKINNMTLFE